MGDEINIIHKRPFLFLLLKLFFPALNWEKHVITIGNTIYSKDKFSESLFEHEKVHIEQFRRSRLHFWKYLLSNKYRFKSELEAYQQQYKKFPNELDELARRLSNGLYKQKLTINECKKAICEY